MMARFVLQRDLQRLTAPFRRNITAKLFAAVFGFALWFFVNAGKRETQVFQFPIELRKIPAQTVLVNRDRADTVAVKLNGPGALLASLDSQRSPIALDLSEVGPGQETRIKIRDEMIHVPRGVRVLDVEPSRVLIHLEELRETTVPVHLARTGEPAAGYKIETVKLVPAEVAVSGPASAVERLKAIETEPLDVGGLNRPVERMVALVRGEPLLSIAPQRVTVHLEVEQILASREIRDLEVEVRNVERPFKLSPGRVSLTVRGPQEMVHGLRLGNGSVYVDGAAYGPGEHRLEVEVVLPPGVEVEKRQPAAVTLQIFDRKDGARR